MKTAITEMDKSSDLLFLSTFNNRLAMNTAGRARSKHVIFPLIGVSVVASICSLYFISNVFAVPPDPKWGSDLTDCSPFESYGVIVFVTCCWKQSSGIDSVLERVCQVCRSSDDCDPPVVTSQPGPKSGRGNLLPDGVFEGPTTSPSPEGPTELSPSVDCAQNPDDPLCETATIPEAGDQGNGGGGEPEGNDEPQPDEESNSDENGIN